MRPARKLIARLAGATAPAVAVLALCSPVAAADSAPYGVSTPTQHAVRKLKPRSTVSRSIASSGRSYEQRLLLLTVIRLLFSPVLQAIVPEP